MRPLRILMFARYLPPEYSGAATQAFLLADRLRARGHHVEFVTLSGDGQRRDYEVNGFAVTALPCRRRGRHQEFGIWYRLLRHIWARRHQIDILHGHGAYYTQSALGPIGRLLGKPTVLKASMSNNDLSSLSDSAIAPVHRWFLGMVNAYVAISEDLQAEFIERGLPPERIWHIPNGVDTERFRPATPAEKAAARAALELPDGPIALTVGVFDERKRIGWLVEQWIAHHGFNTGAVLVAVGPTSRDPDGPAVRARLEALAAAHPALVIVREHTPVIERYYQAADLLVFPSNKEGLPNAVLEAMASGLPCVAARAPGTRELVRDALNGATFATDDSAALQGALLLIQGPDAPTIGAAGRVIAMAEFTIVRVAERYEALYDYLAHGSADISEHRM